MLPFVEVDTNFRLVSEVGTDVLQDVLRRDVAPECHLVDCDGWPVECAVLLPVEGILAKDGVVSCV